MKNNISIFRKIALVLLTLFTAGLMVNCVGDELFRDDLPDSNSEIDTSLPVADFSYLSDVDDFRIVNFTDLSVESTMYLWNFGGGATSTLKDPTYTFEAGEGTYPVTLTTSDANGATDSTTIDVVVVEPEEPEAIIPVIGGYQFESSGDPLCADSRDCWRLSGATIHQTSSNGDGGTRSAKYTTAAEASPRVSYQAITVSPNTAYVLKFRYSIRIDGVGDSLRASVIDGQLSNFSEFAAATLLAQASATQPTGGVDNYADFSVPFETGANGEISLLFDHPANVDSVWLDNVSIDVQ